MKVSVITINRNNAIGLERTMKSVFSQTFQEFEYVVVDGASSDDSVSVIKSFGGYAFKWVSEPDTGIYNAMNKGVKMAEGEYVIFLNSGDSFCADDVLERVFTKEKLEEDIIIGNINIEEKGQIIHRDEALRHKQISLFSLYLYGIPHQASFIRRSLFDKYLYDEDIKINADWKFFLQTIVLDSVPVKILDTTIANFDNSGLSSSNMEKLLIERKRVYSELIPERIRSDYDFVFDHYYEVYRIQWLLSHRVAYRIYRLLVSCFMKILG